MSNALLASERQKRGIRFDPRAKFVALIIVASILLSVGNEGFMGLIRTVLALLPLVLLALSHRIRAGLVYIVAYATASAVSVLSSTFLTGPLLFLALGMTGIIRQFLPGIMMGFWFVSTTTVSEFMAACDRLRLSQAIEIPLVVMMRYFPTIAQDYSQISDAAKMKGLGLSQGPVTAAENRLVPLLASAVRGGEDLSAAALTRGLGAPIQRTNVCQIGIRGCDAVLLLICAAAAVSVIAVNML